MALVIPPIVLAAIALATALPPGRTVQTPGDVVRLAVTHLPSAISTRTRMTLAGLRAAPEATHLTIVRSHDIRALLRAFATSAVQPLQRPSSGSATLASGYDARWDFVVERKDGVRSEVACDAFGRVGSIDGTPRAFRSLEPVLRELARRYPELERTR